MSDYTATYDGAALDSAEAVVAGADFDVEFSALETAIATKADKVTTPTLDNILSMDSSGNLKDSSIATSEVVTLSGSQILSNKTLTSAVLNTSVSGTAFLDEDNMASDSATKLASQQSIKAYVDTSVAALSAAVPTLTVLAAPELLVSTNPSSTAWNTVNSTTLNAAGARYAILKVYASRSEISATSVVVQAYLRKTGSGLAQGIQTLVAYNREALSSAGVISTSALGETVVALDGSYDFDWSVDSAGVDAISIYLVGYYV